MFAVNVFEVLSALHCVGLASPRLAIGEDADVVPFQEPLAKGQSQGGEDVQLGGRFVQHLIEIKDLQRLRVKDDVLLLFGLEDAGVGSFTGLLGVDGPYSDNHLNILSIRHLKL